LSPAPVSLVDHESVGLALSDTAITGDTFERGFLIDLLGSHQFFNIFYY